MFLWYTYFWFMIRRSNKSLERRLFTFHVLLFFLPSANHFSDAILTRLCQEYALCPPCSGLLSFFSIYSFIHTRYCSLFIVYSLFTIVRSSISGSFYALLTKGFHLPTRFQSVTFFNKSSVVFSVLQKKKNLSFFLISKEKRKNLGLKQCKPNKGRAERIRSSTSKRRKKTKYTKCISNGFSVSI